MTKPTLTLILLLMGWSGLQQYQLGQQQQQSQQLQQDFIKLKQQYSQLHDQWLAWQRQTQTTKSESLDQTHATQAHYAQLYIQEQLQFIQFCLQQRESTLALDKFNQLEQHVREHMTQLPKINEHGLLAALAKDRTQLIEYQQQLTQQHLRIHSLLQHLEHLIVQHLTDTSQYLKYESDTQAKSLWQKLFIVEQVEQVNHTQVYHQILLKEVQLELMMLQQLVISSPSPQAIQSQIQRIQDKIQQLPAPMARTMTQEITPLIAVLNLPSPKLLTLTLFESPHLTQMNPVPPRESQP